MKTLIAANPYAWPHDGKLRPETTAFFIIDMQRDFCEAGGYIESMGYDIAALRAILPEILRLRQLIREWGALVFYTREGHRADLSDLPRHKAWRSKLGGGIGIGGKGPMGRFLVRGEAGHDIIMELTPRVGEIVVDKPGYSSFYATDLERILQRAGITHIILTGITTDVCVHSTLRESVDRGFECLVIADACAATEASNHDAALRTITTEGGIFGAVADADALAEWLVSQLPAAARTVPMSGGMV